MESLFKQKTLFSSAMIVAVMSFSACGEKKEVYAPTDRGPVQESPNSNAQGKEGDSEVKSQGDDKSKGDNKSRGDETSSNPSNSKKNGGLEIPPPPGPGPGSDPIPDQAPVPQVPAPVPTPKRGSQQDPMIPIPAPTPKRDSQQDPKIPIPAPTVPPKLNPPQPPPLPPPVQAPPQSSESNYNYDSKNPNNVENSGFRKSYTGMGERDGLVYTGSAPDNLLAYLRERSEDPSLDAGIKARNLETARRVISARLTKSYRDVSINLELSENGSTKIYVLEGRFGDSRATSLQLVQTTGSQNIEASIKCMDADGGCNTTMLKLLIGERGARGVARIVFRNSLADVYLSLPGQRSGNPEYEAMRGFWVNSILKIQDTDHKIKEVVLSSYEVVNGRSGFDVQVIGENRQLMVFAGPLLAPESSTRVNIRADRSIETTDSKFYEYDLANSIGTAAIMNNNGLGQLKFALKMRPRSGYEQDVFTLTVMRIVKPILTLNEEAVKL